MVHPHPKTGPKVKKTPSSRKLHSVILDIKGVRKGVGVGVNPPLELDILQNFIACAKEINCFRILFAC